MALFRLDGKQLAVVSVPLALLSASLELNDCFTPEQTDLVKGGSVIPKKGSQQGSTVDGRFTI
jgi:hypothetical protein